MVKKPVTETIIAAFIQGHLYRLSKIIVMVNRIRLQTTKFAGSV